MTILGNAITSVANSRYEDNPTSQDYGKWLERKTQDNLNNLIVITAQSIKRYKITTSGYDPYEDVKSYFTIQFINDYTQEEFQKLKKYALNTYTKTSRNYINNQLVSTVTSKRYILKTINIDYVININNREFIFTLQATPSMIEEEIIFHDTNTKTVNTREIQLLAKIEK